MTEILKKKQEIDEPIVIWVCEDCGSEEVEERVWVKVNSDEFAGDCGGDNNDRWCPDCENHVGFVTQDEFIENEE